MRSKGGVRGNWTCEGVIEEINSWLDDLAGQDLTAMPAEALGDYQIALQRICNRVQGEALRGLRRFDIDQGYAPSGALTTKSWLRWKCNLTDNAASDQVEVARLLDSLPKTAQALGDGDISYRHAALIARTAEQLGDRMEAHAEGILVTAAKDLDPKRLRRLTEQLRHCLQPDDVLADAREAHERRFLSLSQTFGGIFRIDGQLDAEGGATLQTALNALMGPPAADDDRTPRQRRADALVEVARRQLDGGQLPEVGRQKPHLMVTVDMAALSKEPGSRAAELEWSQPIPAETARRIACDSAITPIFRGAESHQVDAGCTRRMPSPAMHRALVARDKGCRFPGCDRPPGLDRKPSHQALGGSRADHTGQPGPALQPSSLSRARRGLAIDVGSRGPAARDPALIDQFFKGSCRSGTGPY